MIFLCTTLQWPTTVTAKQKVTANSKIELTYGKTKLTHGKTKKTSWSVVGQRLLFASEMVRGVTVTKRNGDLCC